MNEVLLTAISDPQVLENSFPNILTKAKGGKKVVTSSITDTLLPQLKRNIMEELDLVYDSMNLIGKLNTLDQLVNSTNESNSNEDSTWDKNEPHVSDVMSTTQIKNTMKKERDELLQLLHQLKADNATLQSTLMSQREVNTTLNEVFDNCSNHLDVAAQVQQNWSASPQSHWLDQHFKNKQEEGM